MKGCCLLFRIRLRSCPDHRLSWAASPTTLNWTSRMLISLFETALKCFTGYNCIGMVHKWSQVSCCCGMTDQTSGGFMNSLNDLTQNVFLPVCLCISCSLKTYLCCIDLHLNTLYFSQLLLNCCIFKSVQKQLKSENSSVTVCCSSDSVVIFYLSCFIYRRKWVSSLQVLQDCC